MQFPPLTSVLATGVLLASLATSPLLAVQTHRAIPDVNHGCRERNNLVACPSHIKFTRLKTRDIDLFGDKVTLTSTSESDNCQAIATITFLGLSGGVAEYQAVSTGQVGSCHATFSGMAGSMPLGKVKVKIALPPS